MLALSAPLAHVAIATTTPWPKRSTACTKPKSFTRAGPGVHSIKWSSPPRNGSIGGTRSACTAPSATCHLRNSRPSTIVSNKLLKRRDSNQKVSINPRATQATAGDFSLAIDLKRVAVRLTWRCQRAARTRERFVGGTLDYVCACNHRQVSHAPSQRGPEAIAVSQFAAI